MYKDDILKFLKENFWKIFLTIILLTILIFTGLNFVVQGRSNNAKNAKIESGNSESNADSAYSFELFLANEQRSALNFRLLTKFLNNQEHKQELEDYLNKNIEDLDIRKEILDNIGIEKLNVIEAELVSETSTILFKVDLSNKSNENKRIAEFYYDLLTNESNPVFKHLNVYTINPVSQYNSTDKKVIENNESYTYNNKIKSIIKNILASMVLSFMSVLVFIYLKEFFSKKLRYPTTYYAGKPENLFYIPDDNQLRKLTLYLQRISADNKLALVENNLDDESRKIFDKLNIKVLNEPLLSALENNNSELIESVILIVQNNNTARAWYNEQIETANELNLQVYNIHLN